MRFFVYLLLCVACASTAFGAEFQIQGSFTERREKDIHGSLTGAFYYFFDSVNLTRCRLLLEYNVIQPDGTDLTVRNLYHYQYNASYSMCGVGRCTAESIPELADYWWFNSTVHIESNDQQNAPQGMKWYNTTTGAKARVRRILVSPNKVPGDSGYDLKKIEFKDGRIMEINSLIVNPSPPFSPTSSIFNMDSTCPTPQCTMFADIAFVLDYSGSVNKDEWRQTAEFVIGVMKEFKFGPDAAAAACIQFNAPSCGSSGSTTNRIQCYNATTGAYKGTRSRYYSDWNYEKYCKESYMTENRTASVLAGEKVDGKWTVSTNFEYLKTEMSIERKPYGNTCQGLGLELAMKVFDNSQRFINGVRPHRVVIAVTDGDDQCPNRTQRAAKKLREEYGAFFIGIGVGMECTYDRDFITNLTSSLSSSTSRAYFPVSSYDQIKTLVDQIFSPICTQFHDECGPYCNGFCGCGKCFCSTCDITGGACKEYKCVASGVASTGCVLADTCPYVDKCTQNICTDQGNVQQCKTRKTCQPTIEKNPGSCRKVTCSMSDGKCLVARNHTICTRFNTKCKTWECAPENMTGADFADGAYDEVTGCSIKVDKNVECQKNKLDQDCIDYKCEESQGTCVQVDTCQVGNTKCVEFQCVNKSCQSKRVPQPKPNTECIKYSCDDDQGWYISTQIDADYCRREANNRSCYEFKCDDSKGCVSNYIEDCQAVCDTLMETCINDGKARSTVKQCLNTLCKAREEGTTSIPYCKNVTNIDCSISKAAEEARELNNDPNNTDTCFSPECVVGQCVLSSVPRGRFIDTNCTKYVCKENPQTGQWNWEAEDTDTKRKCVSDACFHRECIDSEGCKNTAICTNKTTECYSYHCSNDRTQCYDIYEIRQHPCMNESCEKDENGKDRKLREYHPENCKGGANWCQMDFCNEDGDCEYPTREITREEFNALDGLEKFNDDFSFRTKLPCYECTCDPVERKWTCIDSCLKDVTDYCHPTKCMIAFNTHHGEFERNCADAPINCYEEVDMSGFSCFNLKCENAKDKPTHVCKKRLMKDVIIDECGNCIGGTFNFQISSSSEESCKEIPDDPMLKEGLAAASIALIVLGAIIIGGVIAASGVIGTKTLLERARAANNQSAHSNPLFEDNEAEMTNPTFAGDQ